jgi:hypothetical protein
MVEENSINRIVSSHGKDSTKRKEVSFGILKVRLRGSRQSLFKISSK